MDPRADAFALARNLCKGSRDARGVAAEFRGEIARLEELVALTARQTAIGGLPRRRNNVQIFRN